IPLIQNWGTGDSVNSVGWIIRRGWWAKMELFRKGLFDGPVLYVDLDSIVTGTLDPLVSDVRGFTMAHDFNLHAPPVPCSTVMTWNANYSFIFDEFMRDPERLAQQYDEEEPRRGRIGDQAFIEDQLKAHGHSISIFDDLHGDDTIASYKRD